MPMLIGKIAFHFLKPSPSPPLTPYSVCLSLAIGTAVRTRLLTGPLSCPNPTAGSHWPLAFLCTSTVPWLALPNSISPFNTPPLDNPTKPDWIMFSFLPSWPLVVLPPPSFKPPTATIKPCALRSRHRLLSVLFCGALIPPCSTGRTFGPPLNGFSWNRPCQPGMRPRCWLVRPPGITQSSLLMNATGNPADFNASYVGQRPRLDIAAATFAPIRPSSRPGLPCALTPIKLLPRHPSGSCLVVG